MSDFSVTFSLHQKYHLVRLAEGLEARGHLKRIYSVYPSSMLKRAYHIPEKKLRGLWLFGGLRYLAMKSKKRELDAMLVRWFDRTVARLLPKAEKQGQCFHGLNVSSLEALKAAKRKVYITFVERSCPHIDYQENLIADEYERLTGERRVSTPRISTERMKQEYDIADYIVVPSTYSGKSFIERGYNKDKVLVVPLSYEKATKAPEKRNRDKTVFLCIGGNFYRKGIYYLLKAWELLKPRNAELIVKGGVPERFAPLLKQKGVRHLTRHLSDEEMNELYAKSHVFILPSIDDGFGMVVAEAMTSGMPVIVTEHVGIADGITNGMEGYVVPIRNPEALAEKMAHFLEHPEEISRMGKRALEKSKIYRPEAYTERMVKAYREAVSRAS